MVGFDVINILLITIGVTNFTLGLLLFFSSDQKQDSSKRLFSNFALAVVGWIVMMIIYRSTNNIDALLGITKLLYISALLIPMVFLIFVNRFIYIKKNKILEKALLIFLGLLLILTWTTPYIISSVSLREGLEHKIIFGGGFWTYVIFLIATFNLAFYELRVKQKEFTGIKQKQILFIILGTSLSAYPAFLTNLIFPWIGIFEFNWVGQLFTIFHTIFVTYAIFKHHLFDIKMILSEILLGLMGIILFIYIFIAKNTYEVIASVIFFLLFTGLAYTLIQELLKGLKREHQLEKANNKLIEIIESKDLFLRMTSHQLRTPLTSLNGFLSLILEQWQGKYKMNQATHDDLIKVYLNAQRLIAIVNDLLAFNAIKANRFGVTMRPEVDVKDELNYLLEDNKYILEYFETETILKSIGKDFKVSMDSVRMKEVFQNLLSNAIYYGKGKIWITVIDEGDRLKILFRDNGPGIDSTIKDKIFTSRFRARVTGDQNPNGSGLGLFISRTIVDMHHGTLKLKNSGSSQGAVFVVKIPKTAHTDKYEGQ
jgi:signal transduction histidine kinase